MKKRKKRPDPVGYAMQLALGVERVATMARATARMPTGTPVLNAAQDAAMAATDRAMATLQRLHDRGPR